MSSTDAHRTVRRVRDRRAHKSMVVMAMSIYPCARPSPIALMPSQCVGARKSFTEILGIQFRERGRGGGGQSWLCFCREAVSLPLRLFASLGSHSTFISQGESHKALYPLPCVLSNPGF